MSNEVWNWQFKQTHYASERGIALGLAPKDKEAQAAWYFTAQRSLEIFAIWEAVFGGHDRFIRVLPSQAGNTAVSEGVLGFRDAAKHADALAIAPYMSYSIGRGKTADLGAQMKDWTVDQMLDHFEKTAFTDSSERMRRAKAIADKYGVKLIAYEGGQHMVAFVKDQALVKQLSATMHACNRHPRMGDMYRRYYDEWAQIGGDVFAVFSSIGQYSNHGAWGLAEYSDSRPADYPKLEATLRWAKNHGQAVERQSRANGASAVVSSDERSPAALAVDIDFSRAGLAGQSITIECFVKPDGSAWGDAWLAGKSRATESGAELSVEWHELRQHGQTWHGAACAAPGERPTRWAAGHYSSSTRLTADAPRWRHVAVVCDQPTGVVTCWVDYHLTQSAKVGKPLAWDEGPFLIGGRRDRWGVAGLLDEVRVVRGVLGLAEFLRARSDSISGVSFVSAQQLAPRDAGCLDVKEHFGAAGDGRTDDTAALNAAFEHLV